MDHFMGFDPYMIWEHNRQMHTETGSLRLRERLRKNRDDRKSVADGIWPRRRCAGREPEAEMASFNKAV